MYPYRYIGKDLGGSRDIQSNDSHTSYININIGTDENAEPNVARY